mmetsp:Transcript_62080/g.72585  ORF Transcript_62080/g.72585 Transcript_62080/m.72585 type:complete len:254 (+) Transcript_62080:557-1318(+)
MITSYVVVHSLSTSSTRGQISPVSFTFLFLLLFPFFAVDILPFSERLELLIIVSFSSGVIFLPFVFIFLFFFMKCVNLANALVVLSSFSVRSSSPDASTSTLFKSFLFCFLTFVDILFSLKGFWIGSDLTLSFELSSFFLLCLFFTAVFFFFSKQFVTLSDFLSSPKIDRSSMELTIEISLSFFMIISATPFFLLLPVDFLFLFKQFATLSDLSLRFEKDLSSTKPARELVASITHWSPASFAQILFKAAVWV